MPTMETSRSLSTVRIHIERLIGLLKKRFAILQGDIPLRVVKSLKYEAEKLRQWHSLSGMNLPR